jgi:ABC-2 type transport system ATP-binding protein
LIVDEPMVGLDPLSARLAKDLFVRIAREWGTCVFISTHSLDLAEDICDRIGILREGHLIALGTHEQLATQANLEGSRLESVFLQLTDESTRSGTL